MPPATLVSMGLSARPQANSRIREFDLIKALKQRYGAVDSRVVRGIGDDAAVIVLNGQRRCLLTTDLLAEGIHFDRRTAAFDDIGFRAATANLSDIAAMGGTPEYLLASLAIPHDGTARQVEQIYRGMMTACRPHSVRLVGGDTSASKGGWFINLTVVGSAESHGILLRCGARAGDDLYVTGTLGDSRAGLHLLQRLKGAAPARSLTASQRRFLQRRHLRPTARIAEGYWLSKGRWATSAIDLSDGLSGDLRHLCTESGVGAVIDLAALPISAACRQYAVSIDQEPQSIALAGGEDYELLFTVPRRRRNAFERAWARQQCHVTRVGRMTPAREGVRMRLANGSQRPLPLASYEHFRSMRSR